MRSVFYGVLLTVFVAGAGYVQAANDQDYISISDEPAFKPKSTVYSDKKKKTKSSTGDDYRSISDEPAWYEESIADMAEEGGGQWTECGEGQVTTRDGLCLDRGINESQGGKGAGITSEYPQVKGMNPEDTGWRVQGSELLPGVPVYVHPPQNDDWVEIPDTPYEDNVHAGTHAGSHSVEAGAKEDAFSVDVEGTP